MSAMNVDEMRAQIRKKYGMEVDGFRSRVLSPEGRTGPDTRIEAGKSPMPSTSFHSLTDRHALISIAGDVCDTSWLEQDPDLTGSVMTLSIAGRHRLLGGRMSLPSGECDAWAMEIVGPDRAPYLYRAGTMIGVAGRLTTVYYRVFLDEEGHPAMKPQSVNHPQLCHLGEL